MKYIIKLTERQLTVFYETIREALDTQYSGSDISNATFKRVLALEKDIVKQVTRDYERQLRKV